MLRRASACATVVAALAADPKAGIKLTPVERMAPARLKAAQESVSRIKSQRTRIPELPGFHDYRAILHAHAEDSAHTGGTRPEMLADAKKVGVSAIFLSNHFRPPTDFITDSWRGLHDGVLFVPGSEDRGFLLLPTGSIATRMKDPIAPFLAAVTAQDGLIFLSHIEERPDHSMTGLSGMEIYNRHADAKKDTVGLLAIALKLTDPTTLRELEESLRLYPDELLAAQVEYPADYLAKWDAETKSRRLTGVAANDCHHNQILLVKMVDDQTVLIGTNVDRDDQMRRFTATVRPGIRELTKGHRRGDVLARLDFDPYYRSFQNVSTHILASELSESAVRAALRAGHAYVSHDWMCDPTGFSVRLTEGDENSRGRSSAGKLAGDSPRDLARPKPFSPATNPGPDASSAPPATIMGDQAFFSPGQMIEVRFPIECHARLLNWGKVTGEKNGRNVSWTIDSPGVYRVEGWLEIGGEARPWVYSNPIYVRSRPEPKTTSEYR
jgi:hypothetical protein